MKRKMWMKFRGAPMACGYMAMIVPSISGCSAYYWDIPTRLPNPRPTTPKDSLEVGDPPETACWRVMENAEDHQNVHVAAGAILGAIGAAGVGTTVALVAQSGHDPGYYASWASVAGLAAAIAGAGIYFLTRAASDRAEYWTMNAAVAQSRGDYALNPTTWEYANSNNLEGRVARLQGDKIRWQAILTEATDVETFADAQLKAAAGGDDAGGAGPGGGGGGGGKLRVPNSALLPTDPFDFSIKAHRSVLAATEELAKTNEELTVATNELTARQAAWMHCAAGLSGVSSVDSAANTALAGLVTTAASAAAGSGGGSAGAGKK